MQHNKYYKSFNFMYNIFCFLLYLINSTFNYFDLNCAFFEEHSCVSFKKLKIFVYSMPTEVHVSFYKLLYAKMDEIS